MTHTSLFEQPKEIKEEMPVDRIRMCKECKRKFYAKNRNFQYCKLHRIQMYRWHRKLTRIELTDRKLLSMQSQVISSAKVRLPIHKNENIIKLLREMEQDNITTLNEKPEITNIRNYHNEGGHKIRIEMGVWNHYPVRITYYAYVYVDDNTLWELYKKRVYPLLQVSHSISNQSSTLKHQYTTKSIIKRLRFWQSKINSIGGAHDDSENSNSFK